ncbi:DUF2196 domain-containing protein [Photobacterium kagoshimensis]|uniref:DUF2196 domain-containing protein n=1 Tax=Photobacterium kagoshimensis TaxID=2910242 RepID=UPI003D0DFCC3
MTAHPYTYNSLEHRLLEAFINADIFNNILTNSPTHPHGIKVRLESGDVGRVKVIL